MKLHEHIYDNKHRCQQKNQQTKIYQTYHWNKKNPFILGHPPCVFVTNLIISPTRFTEHRLRGNLQVPAARSRGSWGKIDVRRKGCILYIYIYIHIYCKQMYIYGYYMDIYVFKTWIIMFFEYVTWSVSKNGMFFFKKVLFLLIFSTLTCGASKFVYFSAEHVFVFNLGELVWFGEGVGVRS